MALNTDELLFGLDEAIFPQIYAFSDPRYPGLLKVGYTSRPDVTIRINEEYPIVLPEAKPYRVELAESAMRPDGTSFMDTAVHDILRKQHFYNPDGEWFECSVRDVSKAIDAVREYRNFVTERTNSFPMRPEQKEAVEKTASYFVSTDEEGSGRIPKFLWNCKMRFGKTFAAYQLAKKMGYNRVLVLTFKPAVKTSWYDDLMTHKDFEGWQFIAQNLLPDGTSIEHQYKACDKHKPIVCFGSFQDLLGIDKETGTIKAHNEFIHTINWDLVIFDEYHYGAWRSRAKDLFEKENEEDEILDSEKRALNNEVVEKAEDTSANVDESFLPITTRHYLFLSGTPFRALNSGEFIEEQIFSWTYSDEQRSKTKWVEPPANPYSSLPRMVMMTYSMPESIKKIAMQGELNEFDLNTFFSAKTKKGEEINTAEFVFKDYVQKWLDLIRGSYIETAVDALKVHEKPPFPFSDTRLVSTLRHTLWFLPSVGACFAMRNLLAEPQNNYFHDFRVIVCAGPQGGQGADALEYVEQKMGNPLKTRSITLSCGKLTTGVTVRPWTGIFMLRNLNQPETYFQSAFRVQSPWTAKDENGHTTIIKHSCYVFDFALNRTLKQLAEYSYKLNPKETNPEKKVADFINFLPVLAFEGSHMRQINAGEILDIAMAGTSATLLARRWESALLVNVDNDTLRRLMASEEAMKALMSIEGFRNLNADIETIINKSAHVKKVKKEGGPKDEKTKKQLSEEEKEYKSKRKEIQQKLIKFATRIPVFMYLTDYREYSLRDVITQIEPNLFRKVTGLTIKDFELLTSLGLFNESLMNESVYMFRRYEDASLEYTGINKHKSQNVGGWSTTISREDFDKLFGAEIRENDLIEFGSSFVSAVAETPVKVANTSKETASIKKAAPAVSQKPTAQPAGTVPVMEPGGKMVFKRQSELTVGDKLVSRKFGTGEVIKIENKVVVIKFKSCVKRARINEKQ